jgi:endoglucanase
MRNGSSNLRNVLTMGFALLTGFVVGLSGVAAPAADPSVAPKAVDPFEQNKRLGRGVNVLGYDPIWQSPSKGRFQVEHFKLIHEAGFNHLRVNLHGFHGAGAKPSGEMSDACLETLDWVVRQGLANKLMVILDFHEFVEMAKSAVTKKDRFLTLWRQLATRYKDAPSEVLFEILNEPNSELTPALWNQFLREALAVIRDTNPTRTVIIGPTDWNNIDFLEKLELPEGDRNIIVTVHYYRPMAFTHQGAAWAPEFTDKVGVTWQGTQQERQAVAADFAKAQAWAARHKRPVYLGEFGAYDKADMAYRVRYIDCVARQAEKLGWSWGYWQFDSDFIVYDIPNKRWVEPIRDALIPPAK